MKIDVAEEKGICVVTVNEEITCDNHRAFSETFDGILDDGTMDVILDLANVNYITSRGLGTIVGAYTVLKRRGGNLVLAGTSDDVMRALTITRLDKVLLLAANRSAAFKTLEPERRQPSKPSSAPDTIV
jgi:anti-anti-sigma factor